MRVIRYLLVAISLVMAASFSTIAHAATAAQLNADGKAALSRLYAQSDRARRYSRDAKGILVFPKIVKAGFMVGAQTGDGVLLSGDRATGFYNISAGSFGLQAGAQSFSYAMFFMNDEALDYLAKSKGWAFGSGPSIVVLDQGKAKTMNTTFGQQGLMGGLGMEGSKITPIQPD